MTVPAGNFPRSMTHLSLAFLGTFQASLADQPITHFRSSNVQGLLVFLVLQPGRAVTRNVLATLFWPDEPDHRARANLRQSLYQLRKLLEEGAGSFLAVTRQTVTFNPGSDYRCDVHDFSHALERGELVTAADLYRGDLLPGFTCDSPEFEDWLRGERERLHGLALSALQRLAGRYLRNGHVAKAQEIARRQLALEPWSETAHRQLIEALARAGHRTAALAQVERCRAILAEELGVDLADETVELAERIERDALQPVDPNLIAGRFALEQEIGRGAVGIVYRGRDRQTGAVVAIKMLDSERVNRQPELLSRFLREGEALQQLDHPNIVKMLAADEKDGRHYLIMEYVAGGDLGEVLARHAPLPLHQSLSIALDIADALTRAHRLKIVHRDLKPANVLLDADGLPRLSDFGVARFGDASELTKQGEVLGTLAYLSPEACLGKVLDERSDIWSFGVLLYEMVVGERPFAAQTQAETITQILSAPLPDLAVVRPDVPEALIDLIYRMLAKDRGARITSVRLVGAELEAILERVGKAADGEPQAAARSHARPAFATPTPDRLQRVRHNLPAQATPFVGREAELAELQRLLADPTIRLVTILGPGGMGKTRLALELAARQVVGTPAGQVAFPQGIFLVKLAALRSTEELVASLASTFGLAIEKELEPLQQVLNFLSNKRLLLLLDNFEQLLVAPVNGAAVITAILQAAPDVKIIVTSRQKLSLRSEVLFVLEGLAFPEWSSPADALNYSAVRLFLQSAQRTRVDFELTEESLPPVTRICRLAEGMPLGIVLAAAWIDVLSLAEIADEMQADVDFLAREMGDLPPRQRSMRAVFDYSWTLLTEAERRVLARLSVFRGGFTREAAQTVTGATLRQLLSLVEKSLLQRDVDSGRFALHELLRQLAAEKLDAEGEGDAVGAAHSRHYLSWVAGLKDSLHGPRQIATVRTLLRDELNIQAAWLWAAANGETGPLLAALQPFAGYNMVSGREFEAMKLYRQTLQLLPSPDGASEETTDDAFFLRACLLNRLQDMGFDQDEKGQTIDIDALHAFFRVRGARLEEALVCQHLGHRALRAQKFSQAMAYFQEQADIYEEENERFRLPLSLNRVAMLALFTGQLDVAVRLNQQATRVAEQSDNLLFKSAGLYFSVLFAMYDKNDYEAAEEHLAELTALQHELWSAGIGTINLLGSLNYQGLVALLQGKVDEAQRYSRRMAEVAEVTNNPRDKLRADALASLLQATRGRYDGSSLELFERLEAGVLNIGPIGAALTANGLGNSLLAASKVVQAWSVPIALRWPSILLEYVPVVACILADQGEYSRAAALLAMGRAHPGCPRGWWDIMALVYELEARLEAALLPEEYAAAQARGLELDVPETAASLLEEFKAMVAPAP